MAKNPKYTVHHIDSPAGQAALAVRGITSRDLTRAVAEFQKRENVRIGTPIGVNQDGFFGSTQEGWRPDRPDAFAEPLIRIPWVQILELLGRAPEGTTGRFFDTGEHLAIKIITVSDATYRAVAESAVRPFRSTGTRRPDGSWLVPLVGETWERLQLYRLQGETDDDALMRLINQHHGRKPN